MNLLVIVAVIALLIAINGLYVAGEFASVSSRRSRLAQMADEGSATAAWMQQIVETPRRLDTFVAACQLGITLSSLILGFYGQASALALLEPYLATLSSAQRTGITSVLAVGVLLVLTVLQVVLGELVPKNIGLQYPERTALVTSWPMRWSMVLYRPLIWLFNGSARLVLRALGQQSVAEHAHIHSPDEIVLLVEESSAGGVLNREERRLLVNTLELRDVVARRVMLPRNRMLAAPVHEQPAALLRLLAASPYSRLPLYTDHVDNIVGYVHIRDLLRISDLGRSDPPINAGQPALSAILRPVLFVPDSLGADEVLERMQREHRHLVIVVDEYGGTAGLITVEDLFEEIIGDFEDEFDLAAPALQLLAGKRLSVRGDVAIDELNDLVGLDLPETEDVETVGGLVALLLGRLPDAGDAVTVGDLTLRVDAVGQNHVTRLSLPLTEEQLQRWGKEQA